MNSKLARLIRASCAGFVAGGVVLVLLAAVANAGPPFRTDDPEPVGYQHWEFYTFSQATHFKGDTSGTLPGVEINYGVVPDIMVHLVAPIAFDHPDGSGTKFGYGDTELGVKYRLVEEDEKGWRPMVGVFPLFDAPTGNAHRGLGTGHGHAFLPLWLQSASAIGRPMAAATGSIGAAQTRTTGLAAGFFSGKSPSSSRLAARYSTRPRR